MPLRMETVAGAALALLLGACTPSTQAVAPTPAAVPTPRAAPIAALSDGPSPADKTVFIGPAAIDSIGGYLPDGRMLSPFDTENPVIAWLDPPLLTAIQKAARSASNDGVDVQITSGWRTKGFQQRPPCVSEKRRQAEDVGLCRKTGSLVTASGGMPSRSVGMRGANMATQATPCHPETRFSDNA